MFDILVNVLDLEGARALDLYAGTGSVGFEALSRGAAKVVFVEADQKIAGVLRANVNALKLNDLCEIRVMKTEKYLKICSDKFDVVYVDPPYSINDTTHRVVENIIAREIVNESGIICVEHSKRYSPPPRNLLRQKHFGSTILSFIKPEKKCQS